MTPARGPGRGELPVLGRVLGAEPPAGGGPAAPSGAGREDRLALLARELRDRTADGALVAFSGGVDSAFLLLAAHRAAREVDGRVVALTTVSPSVPRADRIDAERFGRRIGVEHLWVETRELESEAYARNDENRCYHCKAELFDIAGRIAGERELDWLLYGYTASDRGDVRPGHRAARERGVRAPLAEAGITKADIRDTMRAEGLELCDKPASPCLASRVMTGVRVTAGRLAHVQELESLLREAGVRVCRVRVCEGPGFEFLRLEVAPEEMPGVMKIRVRLAERGRELGYRWVTLDLAGYRTGGGRA